MSHSIDELLLRNKRWAAKMVATDPQFFARLSQQQAPEFLWIGCSDSRVPASEISNLLPGELFVHRNVANIVVHSDLNCLAVLQFAVDVLKVKHIIVCGHYGCGGVRAAVNNEKHGLIDNWLRHVQDVGQKHEENLACHQPASEPLLDSMCELNVIEQVLNVCESTIVEDAWRRGQALSVHGWIYSIRDGLLQDLGMCVTQQAEVSAQYQLAIASFNAQNSQRCAGAADRLGVAS